MPAIRTVTITEARKNFSKVLLRAHRSGEVIIEKNGKPFASLKPIRMPPTGAQILKNWSRKKRLRLPPDEARKFADDLENIHKALNVPLVIK